MMGRLVVVLAPFAVAVVGLVVVLALIPRRRRRVTVDEISYPGLAALRRTTTLARVAGVLTGGAMAAACASQTTGWGAHGRGLMLAPLVFGIVLLLALIVGDREAHGDARSRRRSTAAAAERRDPRDLVPPGLTAAVSVLVVGGVALLLGAWAVGSPDDLGRRGRAFRTFSPDGSWSSMSAPWPGEYYGSFALPGLLLLLLVGLVGLVLVSRRPRDGSDPEIVRVDDAIRRREAESLISAVGFASAALVAGLGLVMVMVLLRERPNVGLSGDEVSLWYDIAGWSVLALTLTAVVVGIWCAVALALPGPAAAPRKTDTRRTRSAAAPIALPGRSRASEGADTT